MIRRIRATGSLATDPSHILDPEALRIADNVMLSRPGIIGPRFGLGDTTGIAARSPTDRPIAIVAFDGDVIIQSLVTSTYVIYRGSDTTQISVDAAPPFPTVSGVSDFAEMRGSLYFTTDDGIKRLTDIADTAVSLAGAPTNYSWVPWGSGVTINVGTSAEIDRYAIGADSAVAYRYVWRKAEDVNGYVRRSAPSSRWVVSMASASLLVFARIYLPTGTAAGDVLELYRTENVTPATGTPGREYYLAKEHIVTSAEVSAGYIASGTLIDDVPDSLLGAALYTNPSQGGIQQSNEVPPLANSLAQWGGVMWYGHTRARATLGVEIVRLCDMNIALDPYGKSQRTGLHYHSGTCNYSNASPTVGSINPTDADHPHGMKVGQYITDAANGPTAAGTNVPALTTISAISSAITIDNALLAANDTITVFGQTFTWKVAASLSTEITIGGTSILSAGNLATKLDGWAWDEPFNVTAANGGTAIVTATEASGLAVTAVLTGTGQSIAYTVTMSANATATNVGAAYSVRDFVSIDNGIDSVLFFTTFATDSVPLAVGGGQYRLFNLDNSSDSPVTDLNARCGFTADYLVNAINRYAIEVDTTWGIRAYRDAENARGDSVGDGYFVLIADNASSAASGPQFASSIRREAFRPTPLGSGANIEAESTLAPARVHWSKPDEPEAVPLLNFFDVGNRKKRVLALVPVENALIVFKEDGIYSVTGTAPNAWIVDEIDLDMRLLAPQAVCALNGIAYAWTDRGVVAVTEAQARVISQPIGDELRELQRLLPLDDTNTKRAFWAVAHKRHGLVIFGLGDAAADTITANWYVFHTGTGRWARWPIASRCAAYDPAEDRMLHSPGIDAWSVLYEREDEDAAASYRDASISGLAGTVASLVVTIATSAFGGFTPAAGDVLVDGSSVKARVESVSTNGANKLLTISTALTGVSFTWHQGYGVTLVWQASNLPGVGSRWQEMHLKLGSRASEYVSTWPMSIGGLTDGSDVAVVTATITPGDDDLPSKVVRIGPPRDIVRHNDLYPLVLMTNAGVLWQILALDLHVRPQAQRVGRSA